eukprot:TRINITY_DN81675_c0_g1_i1.p1 TRINITY_DN81675_c0_g1~~TRINITY_DN81675_c0_g1_i1.p1  ORF type:complete len:144 (-),score=31.52 TRINITY_DN81675_c0_g1_i1:118-549(-)
MALRPVSEECLFCKIIAGVIPSSKVFESEHVLAILDAFPVCKGHVLVLPKGHWEFLQDVPDEILGDIMKTIKHMEKAVLSLEGVTACNVFQNNGKDAGQIIPHVHFHIIARRPEDQLIKYPPSGPMIDAQDASKLVDELRKAI